MSSAGKELGYYYQHDFMSRIKLRVDRVKQFVEYLREIENQEFKDLNLGDSEVRFCDKIEEGITNQIEKVMKSANKKQLEEDL